jgi:DNA polymerase-3 subunit beta
MIIQIEKDRLLEALGRVSPIADKRTTLPILSHILFDIESERIILMATDLEIGLKIFLPVASEEAGRIALPSKKLFEIVKELPSGPIEIESSEEYRMRIQAGTSVFHLSGMDPADYPAFGDYSDVEFSGIDADSFNWMIEKTLYAASTDDIRFNLNGVLFEQKDHLMCLVGTDGHRLAYAENELGITIPRSLVVPKKGLNELTRILESTKGEVQLGFDKKNMYIKNDEFAMTIRLIDGDYPDYRRVIPSQPRGKLSINVKRLVQGLRRAAIFTTDRSRGITVVVSEEGMVLNAEHPEFGRFEEKIEAEYEGEPFDVIVNVYYFMEALHAIESEGVTIEYYREGGPLILRPQPEANYFNLVMPMKR